MGLDLAQQIGEQEGGGAIAGRACLTFATGDAMPKSMLYRAGAVCAILGTLIAGVANGVHPDTPTDPLAFLQVVAGSRYWAGIHWALLIGLVLMQIGFLAVKLTLRDDPSPHDAGGWGRAGFHVLTVGLALWAGVCVAEAAVKGLADGARGDPGLLGAARAVAALGDAGITAAEIVYWLGIALLGLGIMQSTRYPRWMGAIGLVTGALLSVGVGWCRAFGGPNRWTEEFGFPILAILTLVWTLVLGVLLWRTAGAVPRRRGR